MNGTEVRRSPSSGPTPSTGTAATATWTPSGLRRRVPTTSRETPSDPGVHLLTHSPPIPSPQGDGESQTLWTSLPGRWRVVEEGESGEGSHRRERTTNNPGSLDQDLRPVSGALLRLLGRDLYVTGSVSRLVRVHYPLDDPVDPQRRSRRRQFEEERLLEVLEGGVGTDIHLTNTYDDHIHPHRGPSSSTSGFR